MGIATVRMINIKSGVRKLLGPPYRSARDYRQRLNGATLNSRVINSYILPKGVESEIRHVCQSRGTIIIGPWLSEVGFELLYWIPFLRWVKEELGICDEKAVLVSRGGAGAWYADLWPRRIEIFDHVTVEEFKSRNDERISATNGKQKHVGVSGFDSLLLELLRNDLGIEYDAVLHPSLMYRLFAGFWADRRSSELVRSYTEFSRLPPPPDTGVKELLPSDYVAVKFYFSEIFPDTPENRNFVTELILSVSQRHHVVLLDTNLSVDDHLDIKMSTSERVHVVAQHMRPENNLAVQTEIVAGARAFLGTYGGFAYLGPFYGVPSIAFHTQRNMIQAHTDLATRVFASFDGPSLSVINAADFAAVGLMDSPKGILSDRIL